MGPPPLERHSAKKSQSRGLADPITCGSDSAKPKCDAMPFLATILMLATAAGFLDGAADSHEPQSIDRQIDAVLGKPILITGIAQEFDSKGGWLIVRGHLGDSIGIPCHAWPNDIRNAGLAAERAHAELQVTLRVTVSLDPRFGKEEKSATIWVASRPPTKYYFSNQQIVEFRRVPDQSILQADDHAARPIRADPRPPPSKEISAPKCEPIPLVAPPSTQPAPLPPQPRCR